MQYISVFSEDNRDLLISQGYTLVSEKRERNKTPIWTFADSSNWFCYDNNILDKTQFMVSDTLRMDF